MPRGWTVSCTGADVPALLNISIAAIIHHARLAVAGLITTGVNWALVWTLLALLGMGGLVGVAVAFILSNGVNFFLQRFCYRVHALSCANARTSRQAAAYAALMGVFFALFAGPAHMGLFLNQALTTILLSLVGYFGAKYIFVLVR